MMASCVTNIPSEKLLQSDNPSSGYNRLCRESFSGHSVCCVALVLQVIGPNRFHIIAYHVLIGNQVIVRCSCKLLVCTVLDCLQVYYRIASV